MGFPVREAGWIVKELAKNSFLRRGKRHFHASRIVHVAITSDSYHWRTLDPPQCPVHFSVVLLV